MSVPADHFEGRALFQQKDAFSAIMGSRREKIPAAVFLQMPVASCLR